jgi:hypothetical protein
MEQAPEATEHTDEAPTSHIATSTSTQDARENAATSIPDMDLIDAGFPHLTDSTRLDRQPMKLALFQSLPSKQEALQLINLYYQHVAWE